MGRKQTKGGVETREGSIRVTFIYRGETCRETFRLNGEVMPPTPANVKYVQRQMETIRQRLLLGTFNYAEFFPESRHAVKPDDQSFGAITALWLASKGQLNPSSCDKYGSSIRMWKKLLGADRAMPTLTYQYLSGKIGAMKWSSPKNANNSLIALRGTMAFYYFGPCAAQNPMLGIKNLKVIKKLPDPLTPDERDAILKDMRDRYDTRVWSYFSFAFYTGMRPQELIALQWGDIDWKLGIIRVARVRTFKGMEREGTKTGSGRDVDLLPQALEALAAMKQYTFMKNGDIFENPVTGKPWHDERGQRENYWQPSLRRLGIRSRRAYCTRHTYATVALMGGVNAAYVSAQMGHVSTKMFYETYARWINGADKGVMRAAMATAFGDISPGIPQLKSGNANSLILKTVVGRGEKIRTKKSGK